MSIGSYAFNTCSGLTTVTIPAGVKSIDAGAFIRCTSLSEVIAEGITPALADSTSFLNIATDAVLYVPGKTKEAYAAAIGWKEFTNINEMPAGDTNFDNVLDTTDVETIAAQIAQSVQSGSVTSAVADVNDDGETDVVDVVATINSIINAEAATQLARSRAASANYLSIEPFSIYPGETKEVEIMLSNTAAYTAFQADVCLPAGLTFAEGEEAGLDARATDSHVMATAVSEENVLRMVAYSTQSAEFTGTNGVLVKVKVTAAEDFESGELSVKNILFATAAEEGVTLNDISVNVLRATDIEHVDATDNAPVEYYNLQGVKVENPTKGIYIKKQGSRTSKVLMK